MAASASASAPGSAERQARGGAALASGNAVSARFPRARVAGRAVRIRWAFGILCLAMVGVFAVFLLVGILASSSRGETARMNSHCGLGGRGCCECFVGWVVTAASAAECAGTT